jgi:hypothetical protein
VAAAVLPAVLTAIAKAAFAAPRLTTLTVTAERPQFSRSTGTPDLNVPPFIS